MHCNNVIFCLDKILIYDINMNNKLNKYCQICDIKKNVIVLNCNHKICECCIEIQKLYTTNDCFLCSFPNWKFP